MVVMPVYNEKGRVVRVIKRILKEYKLEVVVVDDGSTDDSFDILKRNFGKEWHFIGHYRRPRRYKSFWKPQRGNRDAGGGEDRHAGALYPSL